LCRSCFLQFLTPGGLFHLGRRRKAALSKISSSRIRISSKGTMDLIPNGSRVLGSSLFAAMVMQAVAAFRERKKAQNGARFQALFLALVLERFGQICFRQAAISNSGSAASPARSTSPIATRKMPIPRPHQFFLDSCERCNYGLKTGGCHARLKDIRSVRARSARPLTRNGSVGPHRRALDHGE
jgi:hypothetical protein